MVLVGDLQEVSDPSFDGLLVRRSADHCIRVFLTRIFWYAVVPDP